MNRVQGKNKHFETFLNNLVHEIDSVRRQIFSSSRRSLICLMKQYDPLNSTFLVI